MARVKYLEKEDLREDDRFLLERPINLFKALANNPEAMKAFRGAGLWIRHGCPLDTRLREMAILQVGYVTNSAYEFSHHVKIGKNFGVTAADISAIIAESWGEKTDLTALEKAVLRAARDLTLKIEIDEGTWAELEAALGHERLIELVLIIAHYNYVVRLLSALKIDVEPEWAAPLDEYESPKGKDGWQ